MRKHYEIRPAAFAAAFAGAGCLLTASTVMAASSSSSHERQQIEALTQQLKIVNCQLEQLSAQNRTLLELQRQMAQRQEQLERRLARDERQPGTVGNAVGQSSNPVPPSSNPVPPSSNPAAPVPNPIPPASNPAPTGSAQSTPAATLLGGLKLWGYGEIYYTRPTYEVSRTQADLARAVFGIGYTFNDRTEFNSEFETEHAVSSASDPGEFEIEQFYIDRQLNHSVTLRAGLFLMPFGFLNEHHEPIYFYGVQRNFVETLIIPSTWREGGLNLHGDTPAGFSWNVGLTTGFDLSKWNFAPEFPPYATALDLEDSDSAPLQSTHQELALANAQHLSQYVALGYFGIPGLDLGAAISIGNAVKVPAPPNAPIPGNQRVTLWEAHARWTPGKFDLTALYAHGSISNLTLANAANPGSLNPIPSQFHGHYLQAAYDLWAHDDYRLAPFVRWEYYDMGSRYEGTSGPVVPAGLVPISASPGDYGNWPIDRDRVWTTGANFYVTPHVVFKFDYQWFDLNHDFTRFDLGLGVAF